MFKSTNKLLISPVAGQTTNSHTLGHSNEATPIQTLPLVIVTPTDAIANKPKLYLPAKYTKNKSHTTELFLPKSCDTAKPHDLRDIKRPHAKPFSNLNKLLFRKRFHSKSLDQLNEIDATKPNEPTHVTPTRKKKSFIRKAARPKNIFYDPRFNSPPHSNTSNNLSSVSSPSTSSTSSSNSSSNSSYLVPQNFLYKLNWPHKFLLSKRKKKHTEQAATGCCELEAAPSATSLYENLKVNDKVLPKSEANSWSISDFFLSFFHTNPARAKPARIETDTKSPAVNFDLAFDTQSISSYSTFIENLTSSGKPPTLPLSAPPSIQAAQSDMFTNLIKIKADKVSSSSSSGSNGHSTPVQLRKLFNATFNSPKLMKKNKSIKDLTPLKAEAAATSQNEYSEPFDLIPFNKSGLIRIEHKNNADCTTEAFIANILRGQKANEFTRPLENDSAYSSCYINQSIASTSPKLVSESRPRHTGLIQKPTDLLLQPQHSALDSFYNEDDETFSSSSSSPVAPCLSLPISSMISKTPRMTANARPMPLLCEYESVKDSLVPTIQTKPNLSRKTDELIDRNLLGSENESFKLAINAFDNLSERCAEIIELFEKSNNKSIGKNN